MKKAWIKLLVIVFITAVLLVTAFNGLDLGFVELPSVSEGVVLGLDLVGGSEITYEARPTASSESASMSENMETAITMLRQRLDSLGYTEATVYQSGSDRIVLEIPNVSDPEEAVQQLGTTAQIEFRDADGSIWLTGSHISAAEAVYGAVDDTGLSQYYVRLSFTSEGQSLFQAATKAVANRSGDDNYLEIVMDNAVISAPYVSKTEFAASGITSDTAIITLGSNSTVDYARYLAQIISAGQLPMTLECIKLQSVGATLGEESLRTSLLAGLIGLILVMLFMMIVYRLPGVVSAFVLVFYAALFGCILALFHVNLTLPGIAGIILTIGMAVDANVIIFERIKEELRAGKTLRSAIDTGYRNAFTAILDSNVTTCIAAIVLWWKGAGTIRGFAITLLIGVLLSMFTMLVITRILLRCLTDFKVTSLKAYGV